MKTIAVALTSVLLVASFATAADSPDPQINGTVEAFHAALKNGETAAVMALLAVDAQILEGGHTESRAEYEKGHLASDIEFARAVPATRENIVVRQEGSVAWATSTSRVTGTFRGREVNSTGAELMVLAKTPEGWRIRAIHWSSHAVKK